MNEIPHISYKLINNEYKIIFDKFNGILLYIIIILDTINTLKNNFLKKLEKFSFFQIN